MKKSVERGILSEFDLNKKKNWPLFAMVLLFIVAMVASMLYPFAVTLLNGVKANVEVNSFPPRFLPKEWHWENYKTGWNYIDLPGFLQNTMTIFIGNLAVITIVLGLASFSLSRLDIPFKKQITAFFMVTLFIPPTTYIVPNFVNLIDLGLKDSYWALWLPAGASAFYLLILKSFFDTISLELFESARIDGASELRCFFQIALPLSIPIFSTIAIFVFSNAWNDWYWPSLILHSDDKYPLSTAIYRYVINVRRLDLNIRFALLSMVMIPPVCVFLIFQKFIMRGLHLGGVKG